MILNETKINIETSDGMEDQLFSIGDPSVVFDILRSKMYSNPILAVTREISCNARDAHREIGNADRPIIIHLPSMLEPEYKIKDFGPGISPDRIKNIFIQYGVSSKRGDNVQTGAYGMGSKTPYSYSDTFTISTTHERIKYEYVCYIDPTKVGKIALLSKVNTDEPNGTEISIPVKSSDFPFFRQWTEHACRHWDVKPIITGSKEIEWKVLTPIINGNKWMIAKPQGYYENAPKLIIDGIEYPLELDALRKYADTNLIDACNGMFVMYFGTGELSLSASREQIYLDKPTQSKIKDRLTNISNEIKQLVEKKIYEYSNLWDANVFYRKELKGVFQDLSFLGKLSWRGFPITDKHIETKCTIYSFTKQTKYNYKAKGNITKIKGYAGKTFGFSENTVLYINDIDQFVPTARHIKQLFDNDKLEQVLIICPNDNQSEDDLNKLIHLDQMAPRKLSEIVKAPTKKKNISTSRLMVYKYMSDARAFKHVSYHSFDDDTNERIICPLNIDRSGSKHWTTINNKIVQTNTLNYMIANHPKISFYGIDREADPKRVKEHFSKFQILEGFINKRVLGNQPIDYVKVKYIIKHAYRVDKDILDYFGKISHLIKDRNSLFLTRLNLHKKISDANKKDNSLLNIYEFINGEITDTTLKAFLNDNPELDMEKINREYIDKYKLLNAIDIYSFTGSTVMEHIAHYVNMIDAI